MTIDPTVSLISDYTYGCYQIDRYGRYVDVRHGNGTVSVNSTQCLYFLSYLGFIPDDAYVTHASIQMTSEDDSNAYSAAFFVKHEWTGRSIPGHESVPTATCWFPEGTNSSPYGYRFTWDLTDAVMRWRSGEPNYGVIIKLYGNITGYARL